jgi:hypothetical protein
MNAVAPIVAFTISAGKIAMLKCSTRRNYIDLTQNSCPLQGDRSPSSRPVRVKVLATRRT